MFRKQKKNYYVIKKDSKKTVRKLSNKIIKHIKNNPN